MTQRDENLTYLKNRRGKVIEFVRAQRDRPDDEIAAAVDVAIEEVCGESVNSQQFLQRLASQRAREILDES